MDKDDDKTPRKDEIKATEVVDFSSRVGDLEKTKATLKASMKKPDKKGRAIVNSDEQELFCKLRADGRNQTDAARIAYPNDTHPTQRGSELGKMPHIQERIKQLKQERAYAAQLVDPQESLIRWNEIYNNAMEKGEIKVAIEAQKQIDKINGAEAYIVKQQLEVKGMFRGEDEEEWEKSAKRLATLIEIPKKE
jgi:phage terminase small subunit